VDAIVVEQLYIYKVRCSKGVEREQIEASNKSVQWQTAWEINGECVEVFGVEFEVV